MPPQTVFDRLWDRQEGKDAITGLPFTASDQVVRDHIVPLIDGGENRESNLQLIALKTHKLKTAREAMERAKVRSVRGKHRGYKRKPSAFKTNRDGPFKIKMDGTVINRKTGEEV
jgi:5-methylcytosine-specific restriction endonuclease McrA